MKNGSQPINPTTYTRCGDSDEDFKPLQDGKSTGFEKSFGGLTKREYFAGLAMQGILSNTEYITQSRETLADYSVKIADELLKQLEK